MLSSRSTQYGLCHATTCLESQRQDVRSGFQRNAAVSMRNMSLNRNLQETDSISIQRPTKRRDDSDKLKEHLKIHNNNIILYNYTNNLYSSCLKSHW